MRPLSTPSRGQRGDGDGPQRFLSDNAQAYKACLAAAVGSPRSGPPPRTQPPPPDPRQGGTIPPDPPEMAQGPTPSRQPRGLQAQLDTFCEIYNQQRPHRAIGRRTPASVYAETAKTGPSDRPIGTPTHIHRVTVHNGVCHVNKRYSITIGAVHNGHTATVIVTGLSCHVFIAGRPVRHLQLDPTRRCQPLYDRPGRP